MIFGLRWRRLNFAQRGFYRIDFIRLFCNGPALSSGHQSLRFVAGMRVERAAAGLSRRVDDLGAEMR